MTGCVTALSAGTVLGLAYLPQHPCYYFIPASIVAKTYSNSLMAILNSRIKPVSNAAAFAAPLWNEEAQQIGSISSIGATQNIVFRRDSETGSSLVRLRGSDQRGATEGGAGAPYSERAVTWAACAGKREHRRRGPGLMSSLSLRHRRRS
ncbi:hypothetical protein HYPSUDRAFT_46278 [Hypholoma sublateritium FD-334 SS-4]|uniref:Uncharacterized protein n=1 Tax=Hypholoma sublateritium (strain FD-334 SS-4) TaxID=945553 RepID=A0A0D2PAY3_HYPSF|nr:hypothetical protein HYPSUDRAFT_46278 [Hypholoma sublateritium FD-334 SS-4]